MRTDLLGGYFIEQKKADSFVLKEEYPGKRNGEAVMCDRVRGYHPTFEDAAKRFLELYAGDKTDKAYTSLLEYINDLKKANSEAVNAVQESMMQRFVMYVPQATGIPQRDLEEEFVNLLFWGEENAIQRKPLVAKAINAGLIEESIKDKDKAMRNLYKKAKLNYAICHTKNGYFRPLPKDINALNACIAEDDKKAISILRGNTMRKKLKADIDAGRIT